MGVERSIAGRSAMSRRTRPSTYRSPCRAKWRGVASAISGANRASPCPRPVLL